MWNIFITTTPQKAPQAKHSTGMLLTEQLELAQHTAHKYYEHFKTTTHEEDAFMFLFTLTVLYPALVFHSRMIIPGAWWVPRCRLRHHRQAEEQRHTRLLDWTEQRSRTTENESMDVGSHGNHETGWSQCCACAVQRVPGTRTATSCGHSKIIYNI